MIGRTLPLGLLLLLCTSALAQSYDLTIHLSNGETVTIAHEEIQRLQFEGITTDVPEQATLLRLLQNYPNPFNPSTTIAFELPQAADVAVTVYDLHGGLVRQLLRGEQAAGRHQVIWDGTDDGGLRVASGVYVYRVRSGNESLARRMILVK